MEELYHEHMHFAIWRWIRAWCNKVLNHQHPLFDENNYPKTPLDVLQYLIQRIKEPNKTNIFEMDDSENWQSKPYQIKKYWNPRPIPRYMPEQYQEYFMSEPDDPVLFLKSFIDMLHTKSKLLYIKKKQKLVPLIEVKKIFEFYFNDIKVYLDKIYSLNMSLDDINDTFNLDMDTYCDKFTPERVYNKLIWKRYLINKKIFEFSDMDLHKVSIDDKYWKDKVIENVFN